MSKIFDVEGPLFSGLGRIADLFWLNVLFLICCIPIFTIGASATALYYVTLKMVKNEECYITKSFFKSFKQNFKQATGIWIIMLLVGGLLVTDYLIMNGTLYDVSGIPDAVRKVILVVLLMAAIVYALTLRYVFPVLARFDNTVKNIIKNSLLISIRHLPWSALLVAIQVLSGYIFYKFLPQVFIFYLIIVLSLVAYISSFIFVKIFAIYMPGNEAADTDGETVEEASDENAAENAAEVVQDASEILESLDNNIEE